ncbi:family with sequence similarity 185 member A [Rhinolophus ferrumequinum]|uniref:Family with sequence similarity 185 member A n=1 Tax=Rhinolophus ferrumequinum TaxID=59479 RepID=A0A671EUP5_RHIFE|nr:family with sequence similarity 185 member A [Rhinolophus ferrumequinum]
MFAPRWGWGLGCLRQLRVWDGEATGRWACRACQARLSGLGGGERGPGSEPGPAHRTLKAWELLSQKLHVQAKGGKVICLGTVYGNIDICASDKSTVTVDKLQGSAVNISTEDGLLKAKYLYTESSFLSSAAGDITLGSVHGNITLENKMGNITVDSSSGYLKASTHQGALDVYVSQLGKVELKSHKGSILVKVPSSLQAHLQLSGKEIDMNSEVHVQEMAEAQKDDGVIITGLMNQANKHEKWIKADAPKGTVSFRIQSWFQSLKLQD